MLKKKKRKEKINKTQEKKNITPHTHKQARKKKLRMWSASVEKNLQYIANQAKSYKILHRRASSYHSRIYKSLMYMSMFLGPIGGILNTINITFQECEEDNAFTIISTITSFLTAFFIAAVKFGNFENEVSRHSEFSAKFASLENNVKRQLALQKNEREKCKEYLIYIGKSFDDLNENSPRIPVNVAKEFTKKATKKRLVIPDEFVIDVSQTLAPTEDSSHILSSVSEDRTLPEDIKIKKNFSSDNISKSKYSDGAVKYELQRLYRKD